ncbi:MAG: hypothetical protein KC416_17755, partial [Myxococcales bacterium]|nr:hypothetical protein [Myxococcales bacterium]
DRVVYLGRDDTLDRVIEGWRSTLGGQPDAEAFLSQVADLTVSATAEKIELFLSAQATLRKLDAIRRLPKDSEKAIEMIDDRIIMLVHDKASLTEEDIANATVIVYGKSDEPFRKQFGPRSFFTPGPLANGTYGLVQHGGDGDAYFSLEKTDGTIEWEEAITMKRASRLRISS